VPNRPNFPIPENIHAELMCLQLMIPNDPTWKSVVAGLLYELQYWFNWQRDEGESGKECAAVWKEIYKSIDWSTMSCCCDEPIPVQYRYNENGELERSTDGGLTWELAPEYDYRNNSTRWPDPNDLGIPTTKCAAADGVVATFRDQINAQVDTDAAIAGILAVIVAALLLFVSAGTTALLSVQIAALAVAIFRAGVSTWQAAFDSDVWEKFRCIVYNAMDSDSSVNAAGIEQIKSNIASKFSGIVVPTLQGYVNAGGSVGLTNMMRSGAGDRDANCDYCAFYCYEWDFTASDGGWYTQESWPGGGSAGAIYGGSGWQQAYPGGSAGDDTTLFIQKDFPSSITIATVTVWYTQTNMNHDEAQADGTLAAGSGKPVTINFGTPGMTLFYYHETSDATMTISKVRITSEIPFPEGMSGGDEC